MAASRWVPELAVAVVVGALAACSGASPGAAPSSTTASAGTSPSTTSVTSTPSSTTATSSTTSSTSATSSTSSSATTATGLPRELLGHVVTRIPTTRKVVALTFDAGASADGVAAILATLRREHVAASFFLTGRFANAFPDAARAMAQTGRLGDHTVDHPHLPGLSTAAVVAQVRDARATILRVTAQDPRPWFRFPYGEYDGRTLATVNEAGYAAVGWTVDTLGWEGEVGGQNVDSVVERVLDAARPGEIVLMHVGANPDDGTTLDADALPSVIAGLRAAGYGFVTLDALLR